MTTDKQTAACGKGTERIAGEKDHLSGLGQVLAPGFIYPFEVYGSLFTSMTEALLRLLDVGRELLLPSVV